MFRRIATTATLQGRRRIAGGAIRKVSWNHQTRSLNAVKKSQSNFRSLSVLSPISSRTTQKHPNRSSSNRSFLYSQAAKSKTHAVHQDPPPFAKILSANRGEIATRILRAAAELNIPTTAIYSHEDRFTQHRYKADQAFKLNPEKSPVGAYLDIDYIVKICVDNQVKAVHPGYGFLSENEEFARSLEREGVSHGCLYFFLLYGVSLIFLPDKALHSKYILHTHRLPLLAQQ